MTQNVMFLIGDNHNILMMLLSLHISHLVEVGYKLQLNSTIYYATISSDAQLNTIILTFTLYLNNTFYQTPDSVTLQLRNTNQFTSYFGFSSNRPIETVYFSNSDPDSVVDPLRVSRSVVYVNRAPAGEYQTTISATVNPQGDIQSADIALIVTQGINCNNNIVYLMSYQEYL